MKTKTDTLENVPLQEGSAELSLKKKRIWELDALRGLCMIGVVLVHLVFDLVNFANINMNLPDWFFLIQQNGFLFFVLISGICATLGHGTFKRGLVVLGGGLLVSYVTLFCDFVLGMNGMRIWFGILHMLGMCMLLYPIFKKLPHWALGLFGVGFIVLGWYFETLTVDVNFLFPLGLVKYQFYTGSDFFPLFPGFGWFLVGAALGKSLYLRKETLFPKVPEDFFLIRFLCFLGRHSLFIYLAHQPILTFITGIFFM